MEYSFLNKILMKMEKIILEVIAKGLKDKRMKFLMT